MFAAFTDKLTDAASSMITEAVDKLDGDDEVQVVSGPRLRVRFIQAKNLINADTAGESDPYCVVSFADDATKKAQCEKQRSTSNPKWNQVRYISVDSLPQSTLNVEVMDADTIGDDESIGSGSISLADVALQPSVESVVLVALDGGELGENLAAIGKQHAEVVATEATTQVGTAVATQHMGATATSAIAQLTVPEKKQIGKVWKNKGVVCIGLTFLADGDSSTEQVTKGIDTFEAESGQIKVAIYSGVRMNIADVKTSDPFCVIKAGDSEVQSTQVNNSLNPVWNQYFTLPATVQNEIMNVIVYDDDYFGDDSLGEAKLQLASVPLSTTQETILLVNLHGGSIGENISLFFKDAAKDYAYSQVKAANQQFSDVFELIDENTDDGIMNDACVCIGLQLA